MAKLLHPAIDEITLAHVFYALADDNRLQIVRKLYHADKPMICQNAVSEIPDLPISTRSHCFKILRENGVIRSEKRGRECFNSLRSEELSSKFPGLLRAIIKQVDSYSA